MWCITLYLGKLKKTSMSATILQYVTLTVSSLLSSVSIMLVEKEDSVNDSATFRLFFRMRC